MQRPHPVRTDLAKLLNVPESKVHIVTGDTGGSFGMKSPVFNEMPLVLLRLQAHRPAGEMDQHAHRSVSSATRKAATTSPRPNWRSTRTATSSALRVKTIAAIGAYLQTNMPAFFLNAGTLAGTYRTPAIHVDITAVFTNTNPVRPYRGNGRPEAALRHRAHGRMSPPTNSSIDPAELRRRNYIPPSAMPFKTGLTFTYDSGEFEKNMDLALELADAKGFKARKAESHKRGKLRGFGLSNTIERAAPVGTEGAEVRFDRTGAATMFSGSNSQGQGHETVFKQTGLRPARARPRRRAIRAGRHRPGVLRRRHRRLAFVHHGRLGLSSGDARRSSTRRARSPRICSRSMPTT